MRSSLEQHCSITLVEIFSETRTQKKQVALIMHYTRFLFKDF